MLIHIPKNVDSILNEIVLRIKEVLDVSKIMLYGSYAKGNYNKNSDLDIAVFIKDSTISIKDAYRIIQKICVTYDSDIQPQIFSEKEIQNPIGIVEEIMHYGIEITNFNEA